MSFVELTVLGLESVIVSNSDDPASMSSMLLVTDVMAPATRVLVVGEQARDPSQNVRSKLSKLQGRNERITA